MNLLKQLDLDFTFFVQFIIVFFLFMVLSRLLFEPLLKLLRLREQRIAQDHQTAQKLTTQAHAASEKYQHFCSAKKAEAQKQIDALSQEAAHQEQELLKRAKEASRKNILEAVEWTSAQKNAWDQEAGPIIKTSARFILEKLISRK